MSFSLCAQDIFPALLVEAKKSDFPRTYEAVTLQESRPVVVKDRLRPDAACAANTVSMARPSPAGTTSNRLQRSTTVLAAPIIGFRRMKRVCISLR